MKYLRLIYCFCLTLLPIEISSTETTKEKDNDISSENKQWKPDHIINEIMENIPKDHKATGETVKPLNVINEKVNKNIASYIIGNGDKKYKVRIRKKSKGPLKSAVTASADEAKIPDSLATVKNFDVNSSNRENKVDWNSLDSVNNADDIRHASSVKRRFKIKNDNVYLPFANYGKNICSLLDIRYQDIWIMAYTYFGLNINRPYDLIILKHIYDDFLLYLENNALTGTQVLLFSIKEFLESNRFYNNIGRIVYKQWDPSEDNYHDYNPTDYAIENIGNDYQELDTNAQGRSVNTVNYPENIPVDEGYFKNLHVNDLVSNANELVDLQNIPYDSNLIHHEYFINNPYYKEIDTNELRVKGINQKDINALQNTKYKRSDRELIPYPQVDKEIDIQSPSKAEIHLSQYSFPYTRLNRGGTVSSSFPCNTVNKINGKFSNSAYEALYDVEGHRKYKMQTDLNTNFNDIPNSKYSFINDNIKRIDSSNTAYGEYVNNGNGKYMYKKGLPRSTTIYTNYQYPTFTGENNLDKHVNFPNDQYGHGKYEAHRIEQHSPIHKSLAYYEYPNSIHERNIKLKGVNEQNNFGKNDGRFVQGLHKSGVKSPVDAYSTFKFSGVTVDDDRFENDEKTDVGKPQETDEVNPNLTGRRSFEVPGFMEKLGMITDLLKLYIPDENLLKLFQSIVKKGTEEKNES